MDYMLTGDRFDARTAYEMGLVSRVLPADTFDTDVTAYVEKVAAAAPVAVRLGKAAWMAASETAPLPAALEAMQAQLSLLTTTKDVAEGIAAFFEKRPPQWSGR
jgi:enoyl-CoA hydratase/carnithine racemase